MGLQAQINQAALNDMPACIKSIFDSAANSLERAQYEHVALRELGNGKSFAQIAVVLSYCKKVNDMLRLEK